MFLHNKNILLDKSIIVGLSYENFKYLYRNLSPFITPPLIYELISELGKPGNINKLKKKLKLLSTKCVEVHPQTISNHNHFLLANLLGTTIPMNGIVPEDRGTLVRHKDGTIGYIVEELEEVKTLQRWSAGQFTELDIKQGQSITKDRDIVKNIPEFLKRLDSHWNKSSKEIKNISELGTYVDECIKILERNNTEYIIIELYNGHFNDTILKRSFLDKIIKKWKNSGALPLSQYAPYAFYCLRLMMIYRFGITYNFISTSIKQNTYFDLQYIYYLPFCHFFSSGDNFHKNISSIFLREDQKFLDKEDLKKNSVFIKNQNKKNKLISNKPFGSTSIKKLWANLKPKNRKNDSEIIEDFSSKFHEGIRIDTGKSLKSGKLTQRYDRLTLKEKCLELLFKIESVLELQKNNWKYVKKNLNAIHVKKFYEFYGDIWRPDSNIFKYYETKKHSSFALMSLCGTHKEKLNFIYHLSIYFDGFYIFDFFRNPWGVKEEFNSISNPDQYKTESLRSFFTLLTLKHLIIFDQVIILPTPSDFIPGLQKDVIDLGDKKKNHVEITPEDSKFLKELQRDTLFSLTSRQPDIKKFLQHQDGNKKNIDQNKIDYLKFLRKNDPFILDQDLKEQELWMTKADTPETTYIISKLKGLPIITNNTYVHSTFLENINNKNNSWVNFTNKINNYNFKVISQYDSVIKDDPLFLVSFKNGVLKDFYIFLREVFYCATYDGHNKQHIEKLTKELGEQLNVLDKQWKTIEEKFKKDKKDPKKYIHSIKLHFTIEPEGFKIPEADKWIEKYMKHIDIQKSTVLIYGDITPIKENL